MVEAVTDAHTPNQGREIWNANDDELDGRVEEVEEKIRVGVIDGVSPAQDGGNVDLVAGANMSIVPNNPLDQIAFSVVDVVAVVNTYANVRSVDVATLDGEETLLALGRATVGDGDHNLFRWNDGLTAISFTGEADDDVITVASHPFAVGDKVKLYGESLPGNTFAANVYFVTAPTATSFKLASTYADAITAIALNLTTDGSGHVNWADDDVSVIVPSSNPQNGRWIGLWDNPRKQRFASAQPATGAWRRGDRVYTTLPSAGGTEGWICVESGTPGVWRAFGTIAS